MHRPSFCIADYVSPRQAVAEVLRWLKKCEKPVTPAFIVEWFGLADHSTVHTILRAFENEGMLSSREVKRAGRPKVVYILRRDQDPDVPVKPTYADMIWRALQEANSTLTVQQIATLTGANKETVSSYVQALSRGGLIKSLGSKVGGLRPGHRNLWRIKSQHKAAATPVVRKREGKKVAVIDEG